MSNKKLGNDFESEFCKILSEHGYWCHNMAQNAAGQPADVIAVKDTIAYLIDCKVCSNDKFHSVESKTTRNWQWKCGETAVTPTGSSH